jgi:hypothetical protein
LTEYYGYAIVLSFKRRLGVMKKLIAKMFNTLEEAEDFQNGLYDKYDSVNLINFPRFHPRGEGKYVWEVAD